MTLLYGFFKVLWYALSCSFLVYIANQIINNIIYIKASSFYFDEVNFERRQGPNIALIFILHSIIYFLCLTFTHFWLVEQIFEVGKYAYEKLFFGKSAFWFFIGIPMFLLPPLTVTEHSFKPSFSNQEYPKWSKLNIAAMSNLTRGLTLLYFLGQYFLDYSIFHNFDWISSYVFKL
jgi:hypothetical protein